MPSTGQNTDGSPWQQSRWKRSAGVVLFGVVAVAWLLSLSSFGLQEGMSRAAGPISMLNNLIGGGVPALLYVIAAFGWGRAISARVAGESKSRGYLQLSLGFSRLLWISHVLCVFGLLSDHGPLGATMFSPRVIGWLVVAVGLAIVAHQVVAGSLHPERWPVFPVSAVVWAPAIALTIVAACNPPGSLWGSEFGGYDALSYHLQLPKEWGAGDRLWPVVHNVYSFLPSYMESAFMHLGAVGFDSGAAVQRMVGGESTWAYSTQLLHAATGLIAALMVARLVAMLAERAGASPFIGRWSGIAAGALLLGTPWTIVVGSLAYNDLAVVAMLAAALLVAFDGELRPRSRALAVGWLMGIACSAKPTALFMAAPVAGVALLANLPRSRWVGAIGLGSVAGLLAMAPWLIRNAVASGGNPVFPFATSIFGSGWWTAEQVSRYAQAHFFDGTLGGRFAMLFGERGFGNAQWAIAPLLGAAGVGVVVAWKRTRPIGVALLAGVVLQIAAWLFLSHLQSRFLLPVIVPVSIAFGVGMVCVLARIGSKSTSRVDSAHESQSLVRRFAAAAMMLLPLCLAGWSIVNFTHQLGGRPNRLLIAGVSGLTGMAYEPQIAGATQTEREAFLSEAPTPTVYLNLANTAEHGAGQAVAQAASDDRAVYLLGDATPLYLMGAIGAVSNESPTTGAPARIIYHTTWDESPLGRAIREHPDDPSAWSRALAERGIGRVLVNAPELHRLVERSRYYDPDVTLERVGRWLSPTAGGGGLRSVRRWEGGYELFEIAVAGGAGTPEGSR